MYRLTLAQISQKLNAKEFSSLELTRALLSRINKQDGALNSFITVTEELALKQAELADKRRAAGETGALLGVPIGHKDLFCTQDVRTSCGSKMLENFIAPYNATVVEKLGLAGCVTLGKLNMDEFAMGSGNENSHFGAAKNPWDTTRVPGGSSGGSAAAVAGRLVPAATGSDTGGSIRQPAALCGLTGVKPTYGRVSRWGMIAYASSLDQGGPIARNAEDCALLLSAMSGFDNKDSTSSEQPAEDYRAALNTPLTGIRIGLPKEYFADGLDSAVGEQVINAARALEAQGAILQEVSLPSLAHAIPAYYVIALAEASSNLSRFDGVRFGYRCEHPQNLDDLYRRSRGEGFGSEVKRRILLGTYALSAGYYDAYYLKAQKIRRLIKNDFARAFEQVDLLLSPTVPSPAWVIGEKSQDPTAAWLSDLYTITANLAGLPALSMPCGFVQGLPVGTQLIAPWFAESRLLAAAHQYQQHTDWHLACPPDFA